MKVTIVNKAHEGYRRAGIALSQGEHTYEVTAAQLAQLMHDPRIHVVSTEADDEIPPKDIQDTTPRAEATEDSTTTPTEAAEAAEAAETTDANAATEDGTAPPRAEATKTNRKRTTKK